MDLKVLWGFVSAALNPTPASSPNVFTCRWVWWAEGNPLNMTNPIRLRLTSQDGAIAEASLPSMDSQFVGAQFLGAAG